MSWWLDPTQSPGGGWLDQRTLIEAVLFTGLILLAFLHTWRSTLIVLVSIPTSLFTTFGLMNLLYSFTVISETRSVFSLDTFNDRRFVIASIASFVAILMGAQMDVMNRLLNTVPLDRDEWLICIAVSLSIIVVAEIRKFILRRQQEEVATG